VSCEERVLTTIIGRTLTTSTQSKGEAKSKASTQSPFIGK